ncbi:hypothetical protein AURDEDRAFT_115860 [Auricularia subglabra TFB-10046 SS5]|nr:hypothetical protein AURDEDRAFT_115860 [Auricularia subglabra TFB-10046 SS5]
MDSYADEKRNSGVGAVGMGMLMGDMSDDDDDDDEKIAPPPQKPAPVKHALLRSNYSASARTPPPQYQARGNQPPPGLHPPAPVMSPPPPGPLPSSRPNLAPLAPHPQPRAALLPPLRPSNVEQLHPSTAEPHPLQAPSTPIVAKFAVASREPRAAAGNPKNRTTIFGDEFWMRFNKMAKEEKQTSANPKGGSSSAFLREYSRGAGRLSKWVWCCTILILVCIAGGIGAGWYFTHNKPSGPPTAFGGSENENSLSPKAPAATTPVTPTTLPAVPAVTAGAGAGAPVRRRRHRATR